MNVHNKKSNHAIKYRNWKNSVWGIPKEPIFYKKKKKRKYIGKKKENKNSTKENRNKEIAKFISEINTSTIYGKKMD